MKYTHKAMKALRGVVTGSPVVVRATSVLVAIVFVAAFASVASHLRRSDAATTDNVSFTFGSAGDFGLSSDAAATFKAIGASNPKLNFMVSTGDLINGGDKGDGASWCKFARTNMGLGDSFPFEFVAGNHDVSNQSISEYISCMPNKLKITGSYGKQYYFDYPAVNPIARFVLASPNITGINTSVAWAQAAIKDARAKKIPWVIAVNHKTYISAGHHPGALNADFFNMLVKEKVDLILQGHDHSYQRSKQLALTSTCTKVVSKSYKAACVSDSSSDGKYTKGKGSVLVIAGIGGKGWYSEETPSNGAFFEKKVFKDNETHGFVRYNVTSKAITASFVRSAGNSMSDNFSIVAPGSTAPSTKTTTPTVTPKPSVPTPTPAPATKTTVPKQATPAPTVATVPTTTRTTTSTATTTTTNTTTPAATTTSTPAADSATSRLTVTFISPATGAVISGITTLVAKTSDAATTQKVEFYYDGQHIAEGQRVADGSYRYDLDSVQLPNGNYVFQAKAYDTAGSNTYSAEVPISVANTRTSTAATFVVTNSDATTKSSVAVAGNCSEDVGGEKADVPSSLDGKTVITSIGFAAKCTDKGGTAEVDMDIGKKYENADDLKVYKDQSDGSTVDVTIRTTIENRTIGDVTTTHIKYTVKDGSKDDTDGSENGGIIDPVYVVDVSGESQASAVHAVVAVIVSLVGVVGIAFVARAYLRRKNQQYYE